MFEVVFMLFVLMFCTVVLGAGLMLFLMLIFLGSYLIAALFLCTHKEGRKMLKEDYIRCKRSLDRGDS